MLELGGHSLIFLALIAILYAACFYEIFRDYINAIECYEILFAAFFRRFIPKMNLRSPDEPHSSTVCSCLIKTNKKSLTQIKQDYQENGSCQDTRPI